LLINDDLEWAAAELAGIIKEGRGLAVADMEAFWPQFFAPRDPDES